MAGRIAYADHSADAFTHAYGGCYYCRKRLVDTGGSGPQKFKSASGSTGGDLAHPNCQPTAVINKIIKYTIAAVVLPMIPGTGDVTGRMAEWRTGM